MEIAYMRRHYNIAGMEIWFIQTENYRLWIIIYQGEKLFIESYKSKGIRYYRIREGTLNIKHLGTAANVLKVFEEWEKIAKAKPVKDVTIRNLYPELPEMTEEELNNLEDDEE
jgi:hypothetical protein